jgi:predicted transglutaminase-like cysteine proteinase
MPVSRPRLLLVVTALSLAGQPTSAWDATLMLAAAQKLGPPAVAALPPLQAMLGSLQGLPDADKLGVVNRYVNDHIVFGEDIDVWGEDDRWASPLEALAKGRGDCEDYAIAKYASLLAAGVAPARLRLVYVRARMPAGGGGTPVARAHMVLAYQAVATDDPLILDNLRPAVLPASSRPDLTPVFSFNAEGLWHGTGPDSAGNPLARLSRWREVWSKVRQEGFL